jgi:hypothetical protein
MPEDESPIPSVYKMKWIVQIIHIFIGGIFLFISYKGIEGYFETPWGPQWTLWVVTIVFPAVGAASVLSPFVSRVVLDRDSVTLKGILRDQSLPRAAVTSMKVYEDDGYYYATFVAPNNKPRKLTIPLIYRFDQRWHNWISTLHKVQSPRRFGIFGWWDSDK